jgi:hypothetical protein
MMIVRMWSTILHISGLRWMATAPHGIGKGHVAAPPVMCWTAASWPSLNSLLNPLATSSTSMIPYVRPDPAGISTVSDPAGDQTGRMSVSFGTYMHLRTQDWFTVAVELACRNDGFTTSSHSPVASGGSASELPPRHRLYGRLYVGSLCVTRSPLSSPQVASVLLPMVPPGAVGPGLFLVLSARS